MDQWGTRQLPGNGGGPNHDGDDRAKGSIETGHAVLGCLYSGKTRNIHSGNAKPGGIDLCHGTGSFPAF